MKDKENLEKYKENVIEEIKKLPIVKEKQDKIILKLQRAKNYQQLKDILKETIAKLEDSTKENFLVLKKEPEKLEDIKTLKKEMNKYEKALQEINKEMKKEENLEEIKDLLEENFIFLKRVIKEVAKLDEEIIIKLDEEIKKLKITYNIVKTN